LPGQAVVLMALLPLLLAPLRQAAAVQLGMIT
jgi:hypothetical protein